jgi:II/X family phage/plasmid replication protein
VSGNPAKWFQGHNIVGSDDLSGLVLEMLVRICESLGVVPSEHDRALWRAGVIKLTRVDVTFSYSLRQVERVRAALRALDSTANLKHRGRGHFYGDAITFGKGSRRYSITLYAKGPELKVHPLPPALAETSLLQLAQGLLRAEVRLQSMQLVKENLEYVAHWGDNSAAELHHRMMTGLQIAETTMLDAAHIEGLPPRLRSVYQLWRDGHDLRALYARRTFYRYRSQLLKHGIDIAIKQDRAADAPSNVVHLAQVLHAEPFRTPGWLHGTPWLFEPRALAA